MLTPEQLAHCADDAVALYSKLNEEIVRDIARRIAKSSRLTETGRLQVLALQDVGMLTSDIQKTVSRYSGASEALLHDLFEDAGIMSVEYDMSIYTANGLNPLPLNMSPAAMQTLEAGYRKTNGNLRNLTGTTAITSQTGFIDACTMAEMKAESGAFSPQQAIVDAVKQIAKDGAVVRYPSGHKDKLDVAVRRNVMTGIGQTTGEICLGYARELNHDLMEITAHAGARPSHAKWQGQIVSLSGKPGYLSLSDIGYGTGEGFKGYNCRHDWYPYFEGSRRMYSPEELEKLNAKDIQFPDGSMHTLYEAEQYQRACERKIRETKRILAAQNEFIVHTDSESMKRAMQKEFDKKAIILKRQEAQLKDFCKKTGLRVDASRTQKYGFGRSAAQRAVWSRKKELAKYTKYLYNKDGTIVVTDDWKNKKKSIPQNFKPFAVIENTETKSGKTFINRTLYDKNGKMSVQIHSGYHATPKLHPYGKHGEHHHYYEWVEGQKHPNRTTDELTKKERKEHADIL